MYMNARINSSAAPFLRSKAGSSSYFGGLLFKPLHAKSTPRLFRTHSYGRRAVLGYRSTAARSIADCWRFPFRILAK
ncbi:hypothetical protein V5799_019241 [Amblyomma americanum]|uniref:Uncharacterized protein n=1 Tax=Amblyomma americanum TaxID=6943 RepID=A0AAQ4EXF8_AMBAM